MNHLTLTGVHSKAMELYRSGAHAEALSFVEGELYRFPAQHEEFYFFRITMAALRNAELKSLQGLPDFEQLAVRCRQKVPRCS